MTPSLRAMASAQELKRYRRNLADRHDGAPVYDTLSQAETDAGRRGIFAALAAAEREHALVWRDKLAANGVRVRTHRRSAKTHLLQTLTRTFGPGLVLPGATAAAYADRHAHEPGAGNRSAHEQRHAAIAGASRLLGVSVP